MALVPIISQTWDTTSVFTPTRMNNIEQNLAIVSDATGVKYSNGVSVKDKIDSSKLEYRIQSATFTNGQATITHSFGRANKIIPLPYGSLIPITVLNMGVNDFIIKVAFVSDSNVADSKVATNYSGTFDVQYFIVPT